MPKRDFCVDPAKMKTKRQSQEYEVIGRKLPFEKELQAPLCNMKILAPDNIVAKSRFLVLFASNE